MPKPDRTLGPFSNAGAPSNGVDEVQTITLGGTPTGGWFPLVWKGYTTGQIAWSATNATLRTNVETALIALAGIASTDNITVTVGVMTAGIGTILVRFKGNLGKQAQSLMTTTNANLTGTSPTVAVTRSTTGVTATHRLAATGATLKNTLTGREYTNVGAPKAPIWRLTPILGTVTLGSPAVSSTTGVHAAVTDTGVQVVVTTGITNPAVPRVITATAGGTAGDIKAVSVTIAGTNIDDVAISEVLPVFVVDTAGTKTGVKAFKTVTSITIPAMDGTGATVSIGFGPALGLDRVLDRDTVLNAYLAGVREGTRPTVTFDSDEVEKNTVTLSSTLNGTAVIVDLYQ